MTSQSDTCWLSEVLIYNHTLNVKASLKDEYTNSNYPVFLNVDTLPHISQFKMVFQIVSRT